VGLSIVTFRYVPEGVADPKAIDDFNEKLLTAIQEDGRFYLSNAIVDGKFVLRACIVNFRTTRKEMEGLPGVVVEIAGELAR
jgi:hypothetical protein